MTIKCHYKNCLEEDDQYAKTGASVDGKYYCEAHYNHILNQAEAQAVLNGLITTEKEQVK